VRRSHRERSFIVGETSHTVVDCKEMGRYLLREVPRAVLRLAVAFGLFGVISRVPWPADAGRGIALLSFAALAATTLIICGTLLYNTFYPLQNHQRPRNFYPKNRT